MLNYTAIRIERLKNRERENFGSRKDVGGYMYENHRQFIEWASNYDNGDINMRSKAKHDEWEKLLLCKQIVLSGADKLEYNAVTVKREIAHEQLRVI